MIHQKPFYKGSEWRKWDLHIHSPLSGLNNQYPKNSDGSPDWNIFISKLEEVNNVSVIGITDYFFIDGYKKVLEFRKQGRLRNFDLILPNVELRLDTFIVRNKSKDINFHVIFSNELRIEDIEKEFIEALDINISGSVSGLEGVRKLNKRSVVEIGKHIKKHHSTFENDTDEEASLKNITVSLKQVQEFLRKDLFRGKFLFILSGHEWAEIDWNQAYLMKKNFLQTAHILETGSINTINWALGKKDLSKEDFINEFRALKPCIFGSDAHYLDKICNPMDNKFCWIKADPTFEGLKHMVYEPEERVRIQEENPEPFKSIHSLETIEISNSKINDELEIKEARIPLNRNLIAVIGGKGAGKTAFLDLISNCFVDRINSHDENSFAKRIAESGKNLNTALKFLDSPNFNKTLIEDKFVIHSRSEYIPQGQIENLISNYKEFHQFLKNLIFESSKVKDSTVLFEYEEIKNSIDKFDEIIKQLNREIFDLENETKDEISANVKKEIELKKSEKEDIEKEIEIYQVLLTEENIKKAKDVQDELSKRLFQRKKLLNLQNLINGVTEKFNIIESINTDLKDINSLIKELNLGFNEIAYFKYQNVQKQLINIKQEGIENLQKVNKEIENTRKKIENLEGDIRKNSELLKLLDDAKNNISELENKLIHINNQRKLLRDKRNERFILYEKLLNSCINLKKKYEEIITIFSQEAQEILSGLEFKSYLEFDFEDFSKLGEDVIDLRSLRSLKSEKVNIIQSEQFKTLLNFIKQMIDYEDGQDSKGVITNLINDIKSKIYSFLKILKSTRNSLHLYEWLFKDYYFLNTSVYFNKIPLNKLSLGQKCTVLIKVYLAQGRNPLLIDQPDDNLDNKFIMDELIKALREAKKNRQIILATNNANLVMNSDAEQIIVAEFKQGIISYMSGSIENPLIKESAIHILEGGEEAFENREKKYGFKD